MRLSVVGDFVAVLGDRYGYLVGDRVDLQSAIHNYELYIREVLIGVLEVSRHNTHRIGSGVGLGYGPGSGLGCLHSRRYII